MKHDTETGIMCRFVGIGAFQESGAPVLGGLITLVYRSLFWVPAVVETTIQVELACSVEATIQAFSWFRQVVPLHRREGHETHPRDLPSVTVWFMRLLSGMCFKVEARGKQEEWSYWKR